MERRNGVDLICRIGMELTGGACPVHLSHPVFKNSSFLHLTSPSLFWNGSSYGLEERVRVGWNSQVEK